MGGWVPAKLLRGTKGRMKGDERNPEDGNFVRAALESCRPQFECRCHYQAKGCDFD